MSGEKVRLADHTAHWNSLQAAVRDAILKTCLQSGLAVPPLGQLVATVGASEKECKRIVEILVADGRLRRLAPKIHIIPEIFDACRAAVEGYLQKNDTITISQCCDLLGASRKYILPFLEELDRQGLTRREGNLRVLRHPGNKDP